MKRLVHSINKVFYYGWIIVALGGLAFFMSAPGQTYSISVFINEYKTVFPGYSSTLISSAYSIATTISGLLLVFMGKAIDKHGQRKMMMIVGFLLAATAFYNSFVSNIVMIAIGFFMLRYFGQGSMTLLPNSLVPQWFEKKRALAISLATIGGLFASLLVPSINFWLIETLGWQTAWRIWSLVLVIIFIPMVFLFAANRPEEYGLTMENEVHASKEDMKRALTKMNANSFSLKEAMNTKEFWFVGIISMIPSMFTTGITFHFFTLMELRTVTNETAAMIIGLLALPAFLVPFLAKPVIDKQPVKRVLSFTLLMIILSMFFLTFGVTGQYMAITFILFYGLFMAIQNITTNVTWPNYFGRKNLGTIRGAATVFMVIGSALGPLPFGISYDLTGGYNAAIIGMIVFTFIALSFSFFIHQPSKPHSL